MAYEDFQEYLELFVDYTCAVSDVYNTQINTSSSKDTAHRNKQSFAVLDLNHELADEMSDDVPMDRLKDTSTQDKLTKKLQKTIAEYEQLIEKDSFANAQERNDAKKLLHTLKGQLEHHLTNTNKGNAPDESLDEKRDKALHEIFLFYAKQHIPPGLPFEKLEETLNTINIGELLIFCKDFGVEIPRKELMLIYKKESENNQPHRFKNFKQSLRKVSELLHGKRMHEIAKRIKEIKHALGEKVTQKPTEAGSENSSEGESGSEGEGSEVSGSDEEKSEVKAEPAKDIKSSKAAAKDVKNAKDVKETKPAPKEKEVPVKDKKAPAKVEDAKGAKKGKSKEPTPEPSAKSNKDDEKSDSEGSEGEGSEGESGESGSEEGSEDDNEKSEAGTEANNRLMEERERLEEELAKLSEKSMNQVYEDFLKFIEIDDPSKYKRKAKGLRLAFDVKDTKSRIPLGMREVKLKKTIKKTKLSADEIKQKVKQMKEDRIEKKQQQELAEKVKYEKNRDYLKQIHEKLRHNKLAQPKENKLNYTDIKIRNMGIPTWEGKHTKVTLDVLGKMHYSDFNIDDDDDFKPTDIMDEDEIKELNRQQKKQKAKHNLSKKLEDANATEPEPRVKNLSKRGVQLNQSQMSEHRHKSSVQLAHTSHKPINKAYDYAQGASPVTHKKSTVTKTRDERSVPRLAQSFEADYLLSQKSAKAGYPRSKQAVIKNRLALTGSQQHIKPNKSVHYRRGTHGGYPSMNINEAYQVGSQKNKLPLMKEQMKERVKQLESSYRAKERRNMDSIMLMHDKQISKGLKTIDKNRYKL